MTTENKNAAVEEATAKANEVATTGTKAVATSPKGSNYIVQILHESQQEFVEVNAGMDLDYVRAGEWLKLSKKGNYVESADDTISYGDTVDVVIAQGEQRYMLWGKDNSPEKGQIVVIGKTQQEAEEMLGAWLTENPEAASRYTNDDISLRYLSFLVPVSTLTPDDTPMIYIFDLPKGDTIGFGKFAKRVFDGKYKALGIPRKTPVNRVVIRMTSEERENGNKESYLGTKFDAVGLFNPADYGIDPNAVE